MHAAPHLAVDLSMIATMLLGTVLGIPVGIPPAPEDPYLASIAPPQCVYYTTWAGMAKPDANSDNATERLLAQRDVQEFVLKTLAQIDAFNTVSCTLRSLTPGVTFRPAFPIQAAPILGDYNGNGVVDAPDYNVWRDTFLSVDDLRADGNDNGIIDAPDYNAWRDNFGATAASVPEPTNLLLLAMATLAALARPQRSAP